MPFFATFSTIIPEGPLSIEELEEKIEHLDGSAIIHYLGDSMKELRIHVDEDVLSFLTTKDIISTEEYALIFKLGLEEITITNY